MLANKKKNITFAGKNKHLTFKDYVLDTGISF
jgi:hypothetical protein